MSRFQLFAALVAMTVVPAFGDAISADGTWHEFTYGTPGPAIGCGPANAQLCSPTTSPVADTDTVSPWTFTGTGTLFVLDIGDIGDTFRIFDNLVSLGDTSAAPGTGNPCSFDIACSIANAGPNGYSSGTFDILGTGSHSITIELLTNAPETSGGNAVFQLNPLATVPEPATFALIGFSLAGLAYVRRRRS